MHTSGIEGETFNEYSTFRSTFMITIKFLVMAKITHPQLLLLVRTKIPGHMPATIKNFNVTMISLGGISVHS